MASLARFEPPRMLASHNLAAMASLARFEGWGAQARVAGTRRLASHMNLFTVAAVFF